MTLPPTSTVVGGLESWPARVELEQWLHGAASEADVAATALRRLVHIHPGYGAYLAEDKDVTEIVQQFSKRIRKRVVESGNSFEPDILYKPLCEVIWKSIGLVFHSLEQIRGVPPPSTFSEEGATSVSSPLSREVRGQLRMLLQTNEELSLQLSDLRRAYLKELSEHRDRQRRLSLKAKQAIESLAEEPVMFYEPLNSLLDQTTKEFITRTVEERMKLEMRVSLPLEEHEEDTNNIGDLRKELEATQQELKKLRVAAAKEETARKRAEEREARLKAEIMELKEALEKQAAAAEESRRIFEGEKQAAEQARRKVDHLEQQQQQQQQQQKLQHDKIEDPDPTDQLFRQLEEKDNFIRDLQQKVERMTGQTQAHEQELALLKDKLQEMTLAHAAVEKQLESAMQQAKVRAEESEQNQKRKTATNAEEKTKVVKVTTVQEAKVVEKTVVDDTALLEAREELEKHLQIERDLQDSIRMLEKALEEAESRGKHAIDNSMRHDSSEKTRAQQEQEIQEALRNVSKMHEAELRERDDEIERLKQQLLEMQEAVSTAEEPVQKKKKIKKVAKEEDPSEKDADKLAKLIIKYEQLEESHDELQHEKEVLEQKVKALLAKLKEKCSDDELNDALIRIDVTAPVPKRKKKKNAFERLYDDAQRRILELRVQRAKLAQAQENELKAAAAKAKTKTQLHKVAMMASLQRASQATNERFQKAVDNFNRLPPVEEGAGGENEDGYESADSSKVSVGPPSSFSSTLASNLTSGIASTSPNNPTAGRPARITNSICPHCGHGFDNVATNEGRAVAFRTPLHMASTPSDATSKGSIATREKNAVDMPPGAVDASSMSSSMHFHTGMLQLRTFNMPSTPLSTTWNMVDTNSVAQPVRSPQSSMPNSSRSVHGSLSAIVPLIGEKTGLERTVADYTPMSQTVVQPGGGPWRLNQSLISHDSDTSWDGNLLRVSSALLSAGPTSSPPSASSTLGTKVGNDLENESSLKLKGSPVANLESIVRQRLPPPRLKSQTTIRMMPDNNGTAMELHLGSSMKSESDLQDATPMPPSAMTSSPVSPAKPLTLNNGNATRSFASQLNKTVPDTLWTSQSMPLKTSLSLPSLSQTTGGKNSLGEKSGVVNKAWEKPRRPGAKDVKHRLEASSSHERYLSLVQGQAKN